MRAAFTGARVVKIRGLADALRLLQEIANPRKQITIIRSGLKRAAKVIVKEAKNQAPVLTGNLKGSIGTVNTRGIDGSPGIDVGARRRKKGPHAHLVEYGTVHSAANPFMGRAINIKQKEAEKEMAFEVANAFNKSMVRHLKTVR